MNGRMLLLMALPLVLSACGERNRVGLAVDLYLHPEAASPEDLIVQAAIRKRLSDETSLAPARPHVRVVEGVVFLSGTVETEQAKGRAEQIARDTTVEVNGAPVQFEKVVRNYIEVPKR